MTSLYHSIIELKVEYHYHDIVLIITRRWIITELVQYTSLQRGQYYNDIISLQLDCICQYFKCANIVFDWLYSSDHYNKVTYYTCWTVKLRNTGILLPQDNILQLYYGIPVYNYNKVKYLSYYEIPVYYYNKVTYCYNTEYRFIITTRLHITVILRKPVHYYHGVTYYSYIMEYRYIIKTKLHITVILRNTGIFL